MASNLSSFNSSSSLMQTDDQQQRIGNGLLSDIPFEEIMPIH